MQYFHDCHWMARFRKRRGSSWNFVDILSLSWDRPNYIWSLEAANARHLEFPISVLVAQNYNQSRWIAGSRKLGIAVKLSFLSCLLSIGTSGVEAAKLDSHFRFSRTLFILVPFDYLTPKTWGICRTFVSISPCRSWDLGGVYDPFPLGTRNERF